MAARQAVEFLAPGEGERVLDVATGTGLAAREALDSVGPRGAVVGTDISAGMLGAARRAAGGRRCWFVQADAAATPFASEVFDAVVRVASVPYFPELHAVLVDWRRVCHRRSRVVVTTPAPGGITTAWALRQAAASEGIELVDPGGPLAYPAQRAQLLAEAGWEEDRVDEVMFEQPRGDPAAAFGWVDSGFAEPLRAAPSPVRERVWLRFKALYGAESVEAHRVLLLRIIPALS